MIEPPESPIPPLQAPGTIGQPGLTTNTVKPKGPFGGNLKAVIAIGLAAFLGLGLLLMPSPKKRSTTGTTPAAPIVGGDPTQKAAQMRNAAKDEGDRQKRDEVAAQEALGIAQGADTTPLYDAHGQLIPPAQRSKVYKQPYEGGNGAPLHPNQPAPPVAKTALQEQQEELEKKEREMEFQSRFQSNLAYHAVPVANEQGQVQSQGEGATAQRSPAVPANASPGAVPRSASMMTQTEKDREEEEYSQEKSTKKHALEVNIDRAVGKPYVIYEGNFLDTVLLNQLAAIHPAP